MTANKMILGGENRIAVEMIMKGLLTPKNAEETLNRVIETVEKLDKEFKNTHGGGVCPSSSSRIFQNHDSMKESLAAPKELG